MLDQYITLYDTNDRSFGAADVSACCKITEMTEEAYNEATGRG